MVSVRVELQIDQFGTIYQRRLQSVGNSGLSIPSIAFHATCAVELYTSSEDSLSLFTRSMQRALPGSDCGTAVATPTKISVASH